MRFTLIFVQYSSSDLQILTGRMLHCNFCICKKCNIEFSVSNSDCTCADTIGRVFHQFQILSVFFSCLEVGSVFGFVSSLLRFYQNIVVRTQSKGRLTQASKEKWRQFLRRFFGGQVTKRIPLLRQARLANKHHWLWDWSQHRVVSVYRTLGPLPIGARRYKVPMSALPPEPQSTCRLLKCPSLLLK